MLMERVVQRIHEGVTGMDLLEIYTETYSMPNGEQEQYQEGEESGGESMDWQSDGGEEEEESEDSISGEEVESPPRNKRHSKNKHDPASVRGKVALSTGQTSKRTRTSSPVPSEKASKQPKVAASKSRKTLPKIKIDVPVASAAATSGTSAYRDGDEEMGDVVTSNPAPPNVIDLPDDDEDPSASTAQTPADPSSLFTAHHVPEDQVGAAKEAIRQAGIMMEQMKVVREASQAAYDASSALQSNIQKQIQLNLDLELAKTNLQEAKDEAIETMNQARAKKDLDLAPAQRAAEAKTALADQKLASVGKLDEENAKLKTALDEANKEATRPKKDKRALTDKGCGDAGPEGEEGQGLDGRPAPSGHFEYAAGGDPPSADPEDVDTVIEEVAKDVAAEANKIATEEAAEGATEDAAKGSAGDSGKAAAEEAGKAAAKEGVVDDQPSSSAASGSGRYLKGAVLGKAEQLSKANDSIKDLKQKLEGLEGTLSEKVISQCQKTQAQNLQNLLVKNPKQQEGIGVVQSHAQTGTQW
nr:uncharacterized protein LOC120963491 [Aegilops tauschii subsp. strangulata]